MDVTRYKNMRNIKICKKIKIDSPIMLATWPGIDNVTLLAIDYIRKKLKAKKFAEYENSKYMPPESVEVSNGIAEFIDIPNSILYYTEKPPLIIFEGACQFSGQQAERVISDLLDLCQSLNVKQIYTGGAVTNNIIYNENPVIYAAASNEKLRDSLSITDVNFISKGNISGMNGTLIGYARRRGLDAVCFLAAIPIYAVNLTNPKAVKMLVEVFETLLNMEIDKSELDDDIAKTGKIVEHIEEQIKKHFKEIHSEEEVVGLEKDKQPDYIIKKLDRLFNEAKTDSNKVELLKQELDRWNLFSVYEDRFLDLFKKDS